MNRAACCWAPFLERGAARRGEGGTTAEQAPRRRNAENNVSNDDNESNSNSMCNCNSNNTTNNHNHSSNTSDTKNNELGRSQSLQATASLSFRPARSSTCQ